MLSEELKTAIRLALGIEQFGVGHNRNIDADGTLKDNIFIYCMWVIEFRKRYKSVVLAGIQISGSPSLVVRCALLLAHPRGYDDPNPISFVGHAPFRAFDLDYPDAISTALQSVNLLPLGFSLIDYAYNLEIHTYTLNGFSHQRHQGDLEGHNMLNLWNALMDTLEHMVRLYDDPEISHLIDTKWIP